MAVEYNTDLLVVNCVPNFLIWLALFARLNTHKGFLFKVSTGETDSLSTIKHLIEMKIVHK